MSKALVPRILAGEKSMRYSGRFCDRDPKEAWYETHSATSSLDPKNLIKNVDPAETCEPNDPLCSLCQTTQLSRKVLAYECYPHQLVSLLQLDFLDGDENPVRTLGDYSKPSYEGYRNTIELPVGNNAIPLRSNTIRLVQNGCSFHGLQSEDPNQHLKDFLKLVDSLDLDGENKERTHLPEWDLRKFSNIGAWVQVSRCMTWLNYDEYVDSLSTMDNEVGVISPESTIQTLPSFKEYTPPVTYPKEVEKTLGTPIEVEPLNETKLEEVGLNCDHNTPFSSREVLSFDKLKPQLQPLPNCPPLDASLGTERGLKPPIKSQSPDSFRMKEVDHLTNHTLPSPHMTSFHLRDLYCYYRPCIDDPKKDYGFKPGLLGHSGSLGVDFSKLEMIDDDWGLESKEVYFLGRGLN
ncbi:hypothetical protein Tco_0085281 [Tanacetum coccineum]